VPGSIAAAQWAQVRAEAPQVAAAIQRYLQRLGAFLAPGSVAAADNALRQFARWMITDAGLEMDIPHVVSGEEWLAARKDLLAREKEVTRAKDAVDAARRELPVTEVTKDYTFTGPGGQVSLPGCSAGAAS
jgi:hypothetical protein